ncbi:MAG: hypothetical protein GTO55_07030, partial [Armatimonadetes bacterium]|nr:hypothetical protein [Armatimonadota bacterium]NIM24027.1 hypothetical protein [Armatimonadota bacterium]NIM67877.1 hypothetical protein [Armatimonadota bacterium]NIM76405.1 hypothetical protein [Armatimonadota bacterium]NIN06107.1 hypothetical protein [Armatimonadota bacterium]
MPKKTRKTTPSTRKKKATPQRRRRAVPDESSEVVLTPEGVRQVESELDHLRSVVRKEALDRVREAMHFGEPMENAELEAAKARQAAIDARIQEL